ncbi:MAG: bifunctional proline dehydrogenase/L-glutamate gamma-semialdehyde dehydrogenase PutA [Marinicaulis sp.]|nr:bifunctional proline dehydrogenase/L-glutamate gamma-semialdehyde dehydrogenase PutA [Marinicaulis sp.]
MSPTGSLSSLRTTIRDHYLIEEGSLVKKLSDNMALSSEMRGRAQTRAAEFVKLARASAERSGLIDKFLQEYGLSTAEGVTLMRLAEALLRTPDATTANALIEDKIEAGDWSSHAGKSPFPLVNFSTRALMLTAAWLDDIESKDPMRRMAAATKDVLDRLGEPVIRASVAQAMRIMGEHFVLGETIDEAIKRGKQFSDKGYVFSFDMLGEAAHTADDAEKYFNDYADAIKAIAKYSKSDKFAENPGISVKLSALHPRYEYRKKERVLKELGAKVRTLAIAAKSANMGFNIDAEEADRLDISLDLIEALMRDPELEGWNGFGVVVQAYQRRASFVLEWLTALARETERRITVRLVKGAYWDSEIKRAQEMGLESYPVFTRKVSTDFSFLACAEKLLAATDVIYPQFATHNALTATTVQEMAGNLTEYELQRLHGMGEALHDNLIMRGARSRIYAPVGGHNELLPYLVQRLLENGANSSFVNQLIDPDLSVDDVVADPIVELEELDVIPNPHIPAPRDHLRGRLASKGWDETHPPVAAEMNPNARELIGTMNIGPIIEGEHIKGDGVKISNPAHRDDVLGTVAYANNEQVAAACDIAAAFAPIWAATPAKDRAGALRRAAAIFEERGEYFMALAIFEAGKSWIDAIAELREAIDFLRYYADECEKLNGESLGVVACISPWNFPMAIFLGQVAASLAAGNAVIAKPAEQTPLIAHESVRVLHEAGIPAGALHFLPGAGATGAALTANTHINGVVFTGSTETAHKIRNGLVDNKNHDAALIAETGGINAMIIDSTALLEQAVTDTIDSAFQSAGQRCSACRLVCVQEDVADRFIEMLQGAMAELSMGDPSNLETDVGPVIDKEAHANIESYIAYRKRHHEGDHCRLIAEAPAPKGGVNGSFIRPVAFELDGVELLEKEIFGPVLHLVRYNAKDLDDLVAKINSLGYGLTMGVHTRIDETMERVAQAARIGNVYVNRNQIGAVVGVQPFGGEGLSGTGPKAGGPHYLRALQKRLHPSGNNEFAFARRDYSGDEKYCAEKAATAFASLHRNLDRGGLLRRAAEQASGDAANVLSHAVNLYSEHFAETIELPGPTGESNTFRLRGRGVILCVGGGQVADNHQQVALSLAAGAVVITNDNRLAQELSAALDKAGGPAHYVQGLGSAHDMPLPVVLNDHIRAVVSDGGEKTRRNLTQTLAIRSGSIIPLLSAKDEPWRFAAERTLTINTTAAGGDVRLLSLSE